MVRKQVPAHQNLLAKDRFAAISAVRGDLDLAVCEECGFVVNRVFDPGKLQYGIEYDNTQTCSMSFSAYLDSLADSIVQHTKGKSRQIVEVGCGQGSFLRKLIVRAGNGSRGCGFDPSYRGPANDLGGRVTFKRQFFSRDTSTVSADIVVCRHVIEHVSDPVTLLHDVRRSLTEAQSSRVFCETPCVEWILQNRVFWDFFYEHCSYFTAESLSAAFERAGFDVLNVGHVFTGQYLWLEARVSNSIGDASCPRRTERLVELAERFKETEQTLIEGWRGRICELAAGGKVALWGAGAKGVTFANLIEARPESIECIVDINPQKQGHYLPGTGHPIVGPEELSARRVTTAILMNPNYRKEALALLRATHSDVQLIDQL